MDVGRILEELQQERELLEQAIKSLERVYFQRQAPRRRHAPVRRESRKPLEQGFASAER